MPMPAAAVGFVSTAVALSIITALLQLHRRPSIPVIDLSTLAGPAADKAWRSAAANGVVLLRGHAIDTEAALDASRRFFELRDTVKHALNASRDRPGFVRGYIPLGGEAGVGNVLELKEGFSYGYEWPETEPPVDGLTGLNVWPHDEDMNGSDWRETMMALHGNCSALSQVLAPLPSQHTNPYHDLNLRRFRLLRISGVP
jgi:isopenicillin N synthase-like dioxygenase